MRFCHWMVSVSQPIICENTVLSICVIIASLKSPFFHGDCMAARSLDQLCINTIHALSYSIVGTGPVTKDSDR